MRTILLVALIPFALAGAPPQGDQSLVGTVKNSITGEPLKGAMVTLIQVLDFDQALPADRQTPLIKTTMAGASGEFNFTGLIKGRYALRAQKPGFVPSLDAGHAESNVANVPADSGFSITLNPLGVLEGTVQNQYGTPIHSVLICLYKYEILNGVRTVWQAPAKATNDLGQFRFWDLAPGQYYVKALNRSGGTSLYVGNTSVHSANWEGFRSIYYGGAHELNSATPVAVTYGTDARADFKVTLEPTYRIFGKLESFTPHQTVTFELKEDDDQLGPARAWVNTSTGEFEIVDVVSGRYDLRATQGLMARGEVSVTVKGTHTNDIVLQLIPGVTVTGSLHSDSADRQTQNNPSAQFLVDSPGPSCGIRLRAGRQQFTYDGVTGPVLSIPNVFEGKYNVELNCQGGYIASASSGSTDLLTERILTVSSPAPPPIEIVLKPGGSLHAKITGGSSIPGFGILLVPAAQNAGAVMASRFDDGDADGIAAFDVEDLAPGDYTALVVADPASIEYCNPAVVRNFTGGTPLRIEVGKTTELTLAAPGK